MNFAEALRLLDVWYSSPDPKSPGYWEALEAEIAGDHGMQVTKEVHVLFELNEAEVAMLRYFLSLVPETSLETLHPDFRRFRTDLLYKLPASP